MHKSLELNKNKNKNFDCYSRGFNQSPNGFHFQIFTNPLEMSRYFESQIDSMMRDFFNFSFNQDFTAGEAITGK